MINSILNIYLCNISFNWNAVTPIIAIIVSITALLINRTIARRNIRLSIQQAIFKTVSEKAKDCNMIWEAESKDNEEHFKVMSELIISKEVIDKSFYLFKKNYKSISRFRDDFYYLFWKQLRTDLRGWIRKAPEIAKAIDNKYYTKQIEDLEEVFKKHYEQ